MSLLDSLADNLILFVDFNDPGNIANDLTGVHTGTVAGSLKQGIGKPRSCKFLAGNYITYPGNSTLAIVGDLTISFWIRPFLGHVQAIVSKHADYEYDLTMLPDGRFTFSHGNGTATEEFTSVGKIERYKWSQVTVRRIVGTSVTFTFNGVSETPQASTVTPIASAFPVTLGGAFGGELDNVRIYDAAVSDASAERFNRETDFYKLPIADFDVSVSQPSKLIIVDMDNETIVSNTEANYTYKQSLELEDFGSNFVAVAYPNSGQKAIGIQALPVMTYSIVEDPESGYISLALASTVTDREDYDSQVTTTPNWYYNFGAMIDSGLVPSNWAGWAYAHGTSAQDCNTGINVLNWFNKNRIIQLAASCGCWSGDECDGTYELLDENDNVIFACKTLRDGTYRSGLWYGPNLSSLTKTGQSGSYPNTTGYFTFTDTQVQFNNVRTSNINHSFDFNCDVASVVKIRSYSRGRSTYTSAAGCTGFSWLRLMDTAFTFTEV